MDNTALVDFKTALTTLNASMTDMMRIARAWKEFMDPEPKMVTFTVGRASITYPNLAMASRQQSGEGEYSAEKYIAKPDGALAVSTYSIDTVRAGSTVAAWERISNNLYSIEEAVPGSYGAIGSEENPIPISALPRYLRVEHGTLTDIVMCLQPCLRDDASDASIIPESLAMTAQCTIINNTGMPLNVRVKAATGVPYLPPSTIDDGYLDINLAPRETSTFIASSVFGVAGSSTAAIGIWRA